MATPRKFPEFELPPKLIEAFGKAIGPTRMAQTSSEVRAKMMTLANRTAAELGELLETDEQQRPPPTTGADD